jgi:hypothetical protein
MITLLRKHFPHVAGRIFPEPPHPQRNAPTIAALEGAVAAARAMSADGHQIIGVQIIAGRARIEVGLTEALRRLKRAERVEYTAYGIAPQGRQRSLTRKGQIVKPSCIIEFYEKAVLS